MLHNKPHQNSLAGVASGSMGSKVVLTETWDLAVGSECGLSGSYYFVDMLH